MVVKGDYVRRRLDLLGFFFVNYRIQMPMDVAHSIMSIPCIFTALKKENPHPTVLSRVYDKAG